MVKDIVIWQDFDVNYTTDIDKDLCSVTEDEILRGIEVDDTVIEKALLTYFESKTMKGTNKKLFNSITEFYFTTDFDNYVLQIEMSADSDFTNKEIAESLKGFMEKYFTLNEISGSYKLDIDPVELEPTQYDYNPLRNEYNTRVVDSIEVNYELELTGNQTLSISDDTL